MIEFSRLTVLVVGELLLGLSLLSGVLIAWGMLRKNKIRAAARHLVGRIQDDKEPRTQRLRQRLKEHFLYDGEKLDQTVHLLTQAEMRLYQNVINANLKQDALAFQQTDVDVENLVLAYQELDLPEIGSVVDESATETTDGSGEIKRLQEENARLSDELRVTMDTMGRMLDEYSSMFAGGAENQLDKGQIKGMFEEKPGNAGEQQSASDLSEIDIDIEAGEPEQIDQNEPAAAGSDAEARAADTEKEVVDSKVVDVEAAPEVDVVADPSDAVVDIIDEVMAEGNEDLPATGDQTSLVEKSLVDELQPVDIELPAVEAIASDENTAAAQSLEEEWARLLEEDTTKENKKGRQGAL